MPQSKPTKLHPGDRVHLSGYSADLGVKGPNIYADTDATVLATPMPYATKVLVGLDQLGADTRVVTRVYRSRLTVLSHPANVHDDWDGDRDFWDSHDLHIGAALAQARTNASLSQRDLAKVTDRYARQIKDYEQDIAKPGYDTLFTIAYVLNVSVQQLIGRVLPPAGMDVDEDGLPSGLTDEESTLLERFRTLSDNGRQEALRRIDELSRLAEYCAPEWQQPAEDA